MLEIILLRFFVTKLADLSRQKGRTGWWGGLGALFWLGGEFMGFIIGGLLGLEGLEAYPVALVIAAIGALVAWLVVKNLPTTAAEGS